MVQLIDMEIICYDTLTELRAPFTFRGYSYTALMARVQCKRTNHHNDIWRPNGWAMRPPAPTALAFTPWKSLRGRFCSALR